MSPFAHFGLALALATLAGVNLYLTVFMVGLAVRLQWFGDWALSGLEVFANPAVMGVALVLFLVEFLLDKVPWVDSLWDSIHTFLRPAGGALLALSALAVGASPVAQTGMVILAVAASLLAHTTKAGIRLRINTSPEPFSNVAASVIEDVLVVAGFWLTLQSPTLAIPVFAGVLVLFALLAQRLIRSSRAILWLIWRKLRMPSDPKAHGRAKFSSQISGDDRLAVGEHFSAGSFEPSFTQFGVTGKTKGVSGLCANLRGTLIEARNKPGWLYFVRGRGLRGRQAVEVDVRGADISHESRFLSETVVIAGKGKKLLLTFHLHRGQHALAQALAEHLQVEASSNVDLEEDSSAPKSVTTPLPVSEVADEDVGPDNPEDYLLPPDDEEDDAPLEIPDIADGTPGIGILLGGAEKENGRDTTDSEPKSR